MAKAKETNSTTAPKSADTPALTDSHVVVLEALKRAIDIVILSNVGLQMLAPRTGQTPMVSQALRIVVDTNDTNLTYALAVQRSYGDFARVWPSATETFAIVPDDDGIWSGRPVPAGTLEASRTYAVQLFVSDGSSRSANITAID